MSTGLTLGTSKMYIFDLFDPSKGVMMKPKIRNATQNGEI